MFLLLLDKILVEGTNQKGGAVGKDCPLEKIVLWKRFTIKIVKGVYPFRGRLALRNACFSEYSYFPKLEEVSWREKSRTLWCK